MKLHVTPRSPYARIARVFALEIGLGAQVDVIETTVRDPASPLVAHNPTGKVPTLICDDGTVLSDSRNICEHFDRLHGGRKRYPTDLASRAREGTVFGCLDGIAVWSRERRRPPGEQSTAILDLEETRASRCFDRFEAAPDVFLGDDFDLVAIALACTVGYVDRILPVFAWRTGRPRLAAWYDVQATRPSMRATEPPAP